MIKVNLLRDSGSSASGGTAVREMSGSGGPDLSSGISLTTRDLIIDIILVLLPIAGYFGYQQATVAQKESQYQALISEELKIDGQLKSLQDQVKVVEQFLEEKHRLESQLDTIKKLSRERLRNVKSLDALQTIIPQKAWLTSLKIKDTLVELEGQAVDDIVISDFMKDLEDSVFFKDVTLASSEELRLADGSLKKFVIKCNLENL